MCLYIYILWRSELFRTVVRTWVTGLCHSFGIISPICPLVLKRTTDGWTKSVAAVRVECNSESMRCAYIIIYCTRIILGDVVVGFLSFFFFTERFKET